MRILIFHGYLLGGNGSNVYNARLAAALGGLGHEVHLVCQDPAPERQPFVDAIGTWDTQGELGVRVLREPVRVTAYRPRIGRLLPVYVLDRYDGFDARRFSDCTDAEVETYVARNVSAVHDVAARIDADVALANHLVMGPVILARALGPLGVPYAVKVHGSALEYTVKPEPDRFLGYAREGLPPPARCSSGRATRRRASGRRSTSRNCRRGRGSVHRVWRSVNSNAASQPEAADGLRALAWPACHASMAAPAGLPTGSRWTTRPPGRLLRPSTPESTGSSPTQAS